MGPYLKALLVVLVFFEECGVIDDDLGVGDTQIEDLVVDSLGGFNCPDRLLEVDVE